MDSRERVIRALEFECPDRVPIWHTVWPGALLRYGEGLRRLLRKYPEDIGGLGHSRFDLLYNFELSEEMTYTDAWGCVWEKKTIGHMGQVVRHPLHDWKNLETYEFPKPPDLHAKFIMGSGESVFERMHYLRGFENLLIDLMKKPKEVYRLRDRIVEYNMETIRRQLETNMFDGIAFSDDWGTQTRLFINPDIWREFFKPVYKKEFDLVHKFGAYVFFHSDGYTMDIIPDLIEIGADSLNIQFPINPIEELGRRFGGKVCFDRGLDRQKILPFGTIEDVKKQAKQAVAYLGCYDGGYIGGGTIASDVPLSNAEAMYKTFTKYGRYPIRENRAHIPQT